MSFLLEGPELVEVESHPDTANRADGSHDGDEAAKQQVNLNVFVHELVDVEGLLSS